MLVADLLCGAGGSSTGCARALRELGLEMELVCLNHWPVAIETHRRNHPEARHYVQDIATVRPHIIVPEGFLDLLMASPTCTHHSVARGGKPTSDQQRSDPWHIITWLTELRVKRMIIENVWEFIGWGPVDPRTGKPIKSRKGEYFRAWIDTIRRLGFDPEWRKLNAADFGDATTRQRFILMARSDSKSVSWPVPTHRKREEGRLELFPGVSPWRPAREIIDWSIKGRSIIGRPIPLAPKTLARIYAGARKFGWPAPLLARLLAEMERSIAFHLARAFAARHQKARRQQRRAGIRDLVARLRQVRAERLRPAAPERGRDAMLVVLRQNADGRSLSKPVPAIAAEGQHIGLASPIIMANRTNNVARGPDDPAPVFTTAPGGGVAIAEPVIVNGRRGNKAKGVSTEPVPTLDTKGGVWLASPFVMAPGSTGAPRETAEPLPTITTGGAGSEDPGCARPMLVEPFVATVAHGNSDGDRTADERRAHSVEEPLGTLHAGGGKFAVVEPFVLSQASGGAPRSVAEPLPTVVAGGNGAAHALISPYYGSGSGETCKSAEEPLDTVTAVARFGMVVPVTHADGSQRARDVDTDPLPTLTTANRGELAVITAQHGERPGQAPRVHDVDQPVPTIAATGHVDLAEGTIEAGAGEPVYDILFRMLEPHELAAAMGFSDEDSYEFAGTKTEKIRQIGNAVSVRKMRACVRALLADAAPKQAAVESQAKQRMAG